MSRSVAQLTRLYFGGLIACYLVFIGFASFYLNGAIPSTDAALGELFFRSSEFRINLHNLRDISTNLLLYMPLGFLVAMFLAPAKQGWIFSSHLFWGLLISLVVEITQAFIGRYSDATDVLSNATGYAIGFVIARASVHIFSVKPSALLGLMPDRPADSLNTLEGIRFVYVTLAFITCLLPLDITVSFSEIYGKILANGDSLPRLILDPLFHYSGSAANLQYLVLKLLMFLPLAVLSTLIQLRRHRAVYLVPALHCLLLGLSVEISNLFIRSGRSDILIPLVGFLAGWLVAWVIIYFQNKRFADIENTDAVNRRYLFINAGLLYCLLLLAIALSPYNFELSPGAIRSKLLQESNFIPFMAHFSTRSIGSAIDIVREVILFVPLGGFIALSFTGSVTRPHSRLILTTAVVLGSAFAIGLELMQLAVVGRYVDVTDCLLAASGALAGAMMSPLFVNNGEGSTAL